MVAIILTDNQLSFYFQKLPIQHRKNEVSKMIENKNDTSRNLEKALEQAKKRVANEKKKQNDEKKCKSENHHKYIMGGIIVKYFPTATAMTRAS